MTRRYLPEGVSGVKYIIPKFLGAAFVSHYLELWGLGAFELMDAQPPLPRVLASAEPSETIPQKRSRLIRELASLEEEK